MFGLSLGRLGSVGRALAAWTPAQLWPLGASSPGMWIDPPTTSSMYQDSAGTTAISAIGTVLDTSNPVGLVLDRKGNLDLGPELVTNGDFSNGATGWTKAANVTISGGVATIAAGAASYLIYQNTAAIQLSSSFEVTFTISGYSAGAVKAYVGAPGTSPTFSANGTHKVIVPNTGGGTELGIYSPLTNFVGVIDNISVKEIPGIHLSQATATSRGVASARANLLVGTATLSTQNVTVAAIPHTITFSGGGTVTASGVFVGALTSGQTFTPTAGTLTLTVAGTVTSAMLNRGSTALTYQAVVSDSSYTAAGFPSFVKLDGTDDALASATFAAGTLTSSMDCLIAVRRDSAADCVVIFPTSGAGPWMFSFTAAGGLGAIYQCGTPTVWVDGVQLSGGTAVTQATLNSALTPGAWHIMEGRGIDLSAWTSLKVGGFIAAYFNGALGGIQLFASGQDANRDKARAQMAAYFGVTLP